MMSTVTSQRVARALGFLALLASATVSAGFREALQDYTSGNYDAARAQFLALAALGDGASQFNLAAMALQGQGGPKDFATGVGWLLAAADNGYQKLPPDKLASMQGRLTDEQRGAAQGILDHYGHTALLKTVLPSSVGFLAYCSDVVPPKASQAAPGKYPAFAAHDGRDGIVITELTVGVDGLARDPEILMAAPTAQFPAAAVEALLQSRFEPATRAGVPLETRLQFKMVFEIRGGGMLWSVGALKRVRDAAATGEPGAQYLVGLAATLDSSVGIPTAQANQLLLSAAQGGQPQAQYWIGRRFAALSSCQGGAKGQIWFHQAAASGDGPAQLALAADLLSAEPSAEQIASARSLLEKAAQSDSFYVRKHVVALMAASPIDGIRNPDIALAVARKLAQDAIQSDPQMFEVAAAAHAVNGDFRSAASGQEVAIKKAKALYWNTSLMEERLTAYNSSRAWRGDLLSLPPATIPPPPLKDTLSVCKIGTPECKGRVPDQRNKPPIGSRISD